MLTACLLFSLQSWVGDDAGLIYPRALLPGDTITIIAPAGDLDRNRIERAVTRLEEMGFRVKLPPDLYRRRGYLAGTDEDRAAELMAAFLDPQVDAIFCGGGGFGTTRILDLLDYDVIRRNPKVFTGFSDITGLHLAFQRQCRLVTFHSPVASYGLGSPDNPSSFSLDYFWRALLLEQYVNASGEPLPPGYTYDPRPDNPPIQTISPGRARGRLTGGNLTLVNTLMGTPYEVETKGRILFLEDRNEEPYRIDRFLSQLRLAGKLDELAGVVLGVFIDCDAKTGSTSLTLEQIFTDYFEHSGIPVIWNWPVGHYRYNATLPLGVMAELDSDRRTLRLLENPVELPPARPSVSSHSTEGSE
jgi:muramoyltetrapeptide carboxypeptidase